MPLTAAQAAGMVDVGVVDVVVDVADESSVEDASAGRQLAGARRGKEISAIRGVSRIVHNLIP